MLADRYTDYMYDLIDDVMKDIGPRESCSEEEKRLGRLFAKEISPACDSVETEKFSCSPTAFVGIFPYLAIGYVIGVVLFFFLPAASAAIALAACIVLFFEVVRYKEMIDPLYPVREGENVAGFVAPSGTARERVYVSAHFDSAYEFKLWYWFKSFSTVIMVVGVLAVLLMFGASLARAIVEPLGTPQAGAFWGLGIALAALSPVIILFGFFHTSDLVPGAMDDMAGIAVVAGLSKYLADARGRGEFYPENTEIVLLGLSSEEAGLRGAKRYASRHGNDAASMPSRGIFLDGIYDERFLTVFTKELWPGAKLDAALVDLVVGAAEENDFKIKRQMLPLGATDASAFALAGIPSVAICLWDAVRLVPHYHTRLDTIERIRPESLAVALQTVIDVIRHMDSHAGRERE